MDLVFHLSGEHETLPKSEALAILRGQSGGFNVIQDLDQVLVCRVEGCDVSSLSRLGMTHAVLKYIGACEPDHEKIISLAAKVGRIHGTFIVRVSRIKRYSSELSTLELERSLGEAIDGDEVDLENPDTRIRGFLTSGRFVLGRTLLEIKRSKIEERNPQFRPFFHPSSLLPVLSRTLCNICGVGPNKKVLDPFCGTGGILIEAGLLGAKIWGGDMSERMVSGCGENLAHFGLRGTISQADATELNDMDHYDVVITDPPYGRASTTRGRELKDLYEQAMKSIHQALKPGGMACIISPAAIDLETISLMQGFKVNETHRIRVHRSLTRRIVILTKT